MQLSDLKKVLTYFNIPDEDFIKTQIRGFSSDGFNVYIDDNFIFSFFEKVNFVNGMLTSVPSIMFTKNGNLETVALNDILKEV